MNIAKIRHFIGAFIKGKVIFDYEMEALGRARRIEVPKRTNYIRINTLELVADEIYTHKVPGAVAELGVYKGNFAKYINQLFPDRKFYLFDTFQGFSEKDVAVETTQQFSTGDQSFADTSVDAVLQKMKHRDNCIVHKGYFPDSLNGLEDTFAFVSLDADLYQPIYKGLEYFYPRLSRGGYIFVHDYNNSGYAGAKQAVADYCRANNIGYVPVSDSWGTVVIAK